MAGAHRHWRVVVSSPGDVTSERERVNRIRDSINKSLAAAGFAATMAFLRAEADVPPGLDPRGGPQAVIEQKLPIEDCDILLCIFWKRMGTPVEGFMSGTEREITLAIAALKRNGKPKIMIYWKETAYYIKSVEEAEQLLRLMKFPEHLASMAYFPVPFRTTSDFERIVRDDLFGIISEEAVQMERRSSAGTR